MKRLISFSALIALLFLGLTPASPAISATVKAGGSCTTLGKTATVANKKYTCIKSGRKLVWNKGVTVVAKPNPTPTAPTLSFDNLDVNWVRKVAWSQVHNGVLANSSFTPNITYVVGPSLSAERVNQEKTGLNRAATFWSDVFQPEKVFIGYFTEKDVSWVDQAMCSQAAYCPSGMSPVISDIIKQNPNACTSAGATQNQNGIPFFHQCLGLQSENVKNRQTGPHEYTHWAQFKYLDWNSAPNWWVEGSAAYFGGTLGLYENQTVPTALDQVVFQDAYNYVQQDLCPMNSVTSAEVVACLKFTYRQAAPPAPGTRFMLAHVSYYPGALATEAMLAVKGLTTFKNFMSDLKTDTFDHVFFKHYGLKVDDFYEKVAVYISAMYKLRR